MEKNVLITGITSGIGTEIAIGMAKNNYIINLVARSLESGNKIKDNIIKSTNNDKINVYKCDLSLQSEIREFVSDFKQNNNGLDILINNAGILPKDRIMTKEGIELQFAVNYIAPFLLSRLLLDLLKTSAPSRIVNTSSTAHYSGNLNSNDFQKLNKKYTMRGWRAYFDTKLAMTIDTLEFAKTLEGTGVTCNAIHPGLVNTNLGRHMTPRFMKPFNIILGMFILSAKDGAAPIIKAACSNEFDQITGKFYHRFRERKPSKNVFDNDLNLKLLKYTENITNIVG
jgi:NAD(P)-dependent dehydrogenase (short-subunit alcohol dehydrogenase family)